MPAAATLIVIGATGDLTGRLLLPALARLSATGSLADDFAFVGAGPAHWTPAEFCDHARARLSDHASDLAEADRESFLRRVDYRVVDVKNPPSLAVLLNPLTKTHGVVLYLALPTNLVAVTIAALETLALPRTVRIAVEKPFGEDLPSAMQLNAALHRINPSDDNVFRVDHVLGMPTIAALPSLLAAIPPIPADAAIKQVSILWEETLALEGRAAFYDRAGALKDLLQNHLLQILCMITMDQHPTAPTNQHLAQRRLAALQAVQIPGLAQAAANSHRARYTAGQLAATAGAGGRFVPDYIAEAGVDPQRQTETLAEVVLQVSSPRWAGTRFVLRAGKAMAQRRRGIMLHFTTGAGKDIQQSWIDVDEPAPNAIPGTDAPGIGGAAPLEQIAYTRVLWSLLSGTFDLSVSALETERAWAIFGPFLAAWADGDVPLREYPAGSSQSW